MPEELYGVYAAVSVSTVKIEGDTPDPESGRSIDLMQQPGDETDPYGGWQQTGALRDMQVELPDGSSPDPMEHPAFGYDDSAHYEVYVDGDKVRINKL